MASPRSPHSSLKATKPQGRTVLLKQKRTNRCYRCGRQRGQFYAWHKEYPAACTPAREGREETQEWHAPRECRVSQVGDYLLCEDCHPEDVPQERTGLVSDAPAPVPAVQTPRPDFRQPCVLCRQPWKPQPGTLARMRCGCQEWVRLQDGRWERVE